MRIGGFLTIAKVSNLKEIFDAEKKGKTVKAKASDLLTLYALLRHVSEKVLSTMDGMRAERRSFEACCDVLDLYVECARGRQGHLEGITTDMRNAMAKHMRRHQEAYGDEFILPKHHARAHVAGLSYLRTAPSTGKCASGSLARA